MKLKNLICGGLIMAAALSLSACSSESGGPSSAKTEIETKANPKLYRNFYEIFTGSFADSNGDGQGDLNGVTAHLDYLNTGDPKSTKDLKVQGLWMTPIFASPSYHGYDVTDYQAINPKLGTMADFDKLIAQAKKRKIAVILDLVLNHTSSEHPWFKKALAGDKKYLSYYNWSDSPKKGYSLASNGKYYESEFDKGMPDLDLSNPDVKAEIKKITKFWLDKGAAGFRLDAVAYYYNNSETKTENFTNWLVSTVHEQNPDAYVVGEDWSDSVVIAEMSRKSDINSLFNFPMSFNNSAGALQNALLMQDGSSFARMTAEWDKNLHKANPAAIDAPFLANHDMNRAVNFTYNLEKSKMAAQTYLLLPGNPFIYYGEELGISGSGIDQNKRLPLPWGINNPANTKESVAVPGATESVTTIGGTVEEQEANPNSLLNWYKKVLRIKLRYPEIAQSRISKVDVDNSSISALNYGKKYTIISNFDSKASISLKLTSQMKQKIAERLSVTGAYITLDEKKLTLPPYSTVILD
ncbi:MAG: alpha-amylase [Streptococcaceae bacterium]|jgi:alpha-amylase|nr:alpha-amylase [Streptococcaceae bacterium]